MNSYKDGNGVKPKSEKAAGKVLAGLTAPMTDGLRQEGYERFWEWEDRSDGRYYRIMPEHLNSTKKGLEEWKNSK